MTSIRLMLESVFSGKLNESKESFKNVISEKIATKLKEKKKEMYKSSCNEEVLDENKLADVMDTVRHHIGPITKDSNISKELKAKAAKQVSKEHGISSGAADKFVSDYCKSCNERYDTDLDVNKNGKLDADDFKKLRAKKKSKECDSTCEETEELDETGVFSYGYKQPKKGTIAYNNMLRNKKLEKDKPIIEPKDNMIGVAKVIESEELDESSKPENIITDPKDRQSYSGHKKMEQNHINQYKKTTSPIKKGHHQDMIQQHSDAAGEILDKYRKESVELNIETELNSILNQD